jgi:hypothetical protein
MRHEEYMKQAMKQSDVGSIEDYPPSADIDMVNSPPHYNQTGIECIHAISAATNDGFKYYLQGNILKYLWRFDYKDKPLEDLKKAQWYLDKLIEEVMADGKS